MHVKRFVDVVFLTTTYDNDRSIRFFAIKRVGCKKRNIDDFFVYVSLKYSASFKIASLRVLFFYLSDAATKKKMRRSRAIRLTASEAT